MNRHSRVLAALVLVVLVAFAAIACTPNPGTPPTRSSTPPLSVSIPSPTPTLAPTPTITPSPTPSTGQVTLRPGDWSFSIDGKPSFVFSRNTAAYTMSDFDALFPVAKRAGTSVVRLTVSTIVAGGMGYTPTGQVDEAWAQKWQKVFDTAQANGISIIILFTSWVDWNTMGYNTWAANPFNAANGGPAKTPQELFRQDSPTQKMWLAWLKNIVARWQSQKNILAWEVYSEVNLTRDVSEEEGTNLIEQAAAVVRGADTAHRPIVGSLADVGDWRNFYRSRAIDVISVHPYPPSAQLDRAIIKSVHAALTMYDRPVLIGESGLNADSPENYPPRAEVGVRHAIWASIVSGAMNGRALYWEDGYALYFPKLSWSWVNRYADAERAAAYFVRGIDFTLSGPTSVYLPEKSQVWGAAVENDQTVIGWFRDAQSDPPEWQASRVLSGQTVIVDVSGSVSQWKADFYSTENGTDIISSTLLTRDGNSVTVPLPDFRDAIAFKLSSLPGAPAAVVPPPVDALVGNWSGAISSESGDFSQQVFLSIQAGCQPAHVCGKVTTGTCVGDLFLNTSAGSAWIFDEWNMAGEPACVPGGKEVLQLKADGSLLFRYISGVNQEIPLASTGVLKHR